MTKFSTYAAAIALLGLAGAASPALAQSGATTVQSAVGDWLYDASGTLVGSIYGVADGGNTVIVQYGSYLTPGRKLVAVPAGDITVGGGHATLRTLTAQAIENRPSVD